MNALSLSIETSFNGTGVLDGCPKTLVLLVSVPTDPKPPLLANAEKPPVAAGVLLPKTLLVLAAPAAPNPDCPNAGLAAAGEAEAHGDGLEPSAVDV